MQLTVRHHTIGPWLQSHAAMRGLMQQCLVSGVGSVARMVLVGGTTWHMPSAVNVQPACNGHGGPVGPDGLPPASCQGAFTEHNPSPHMASRQDTSTESKQHPCRGSQPPFCPGGTGYNAAARGKQPASPPRMLLSLIFHRLPHEHVPHLPHSCPPQISTPPHTPGRQARQGRHSACISSQAVPALASVSVRASGQVQ